MRSPMTLLLQDPGDRGYPAEYLLARIKGRRSRLITEWRQLLFDPAVQGYPASNRHQGSTQERTAAGIRSSLAREYGWVYRQMNEQLRQIFRPFFLYNELRTLFACLRFLTGANAGRVNEVLELSLLADQLKDVLLSGRDAEAAVRGIETQFRGLSNGFSGLAETLGVDGLRGVEQKIIREYLTTLMEMRLHPLMKNFFARLIDARNIMSVYKYLRLDQAMLPPFLPQGTIAQERLAEAVGKQDLFGVCTLIRTSFRIGIESPDPSKVEISLYKGITGFLKKQGRQPSGPGPILDYLWRCSLEAMNLNVLVSTRDLERDAAAAELVL